MCYTSTTFQDWSIISGRRRDRLRGSLHGTSFCIKQNTSACWRPWNQHVWHRVPKWNLLRTQPFFQLCKLASKVFVNAMTTLMLMLAWVNAFHSSHFKTLIKDFRSAPKAGRIWQQSIEANLSVCSIILEVKLWLKFFNLWLLRA